MAQMVCNLLKHNSTKDLTIECSCNCSIARVEENKFIIKDILACFQYNVTLKKIFDSS